MSTLSPSPIFLQVTSILPHFLQHIPIPNSHETIIIFLLTDLGIAVDTAESMVPCLTPPDLQRLADCLKPAPKGLFQKAFLPESK